MILFITLLVLLIIGVPVAFSLGISAFIYIMSEGFKLSIVMQRMVDGLNSYSMMALPMFVLAGSIMAYGVTPRLIRFADMIVGRIPGGLGAVEIVSSSFFGAVSGSGAATVSAIGGMIGPEMDKQQYDRGYAASLICTTGGLGTLIPPSIPMVTYCITAGLSVGTMFLTGIVPGILTAVILVIYNTIICKRNHYGTKKRYHYSIKEVVKITASAFLPLLMPVFVLGSVLKGIVTATEASVVAVVYSAFLAGVVYREFNWKAYRKVCAESLSVCGIIMFIIACSSPFSWAITIKKLAVILTNFLLNISTNKTIIIILIIILLCILGTFMESTAIILLTTSILFPVVTQIDFNPYLYGVILIMCTNIGTMTPPLAVGLFLSCRIMKIKVEQSFYHILRFIVVMLFCVFLVLLIPEIALWLPGL